MPFVRKSNAQSSQPPTDARKIFVGRVNELYFFLEDILKPGKPANNIISIYGQGGVGKTTLLNRLIEEAHTANFKDYCLTARVNERQIKPASMMAQFAEQLNLGGSFAKILSRYREVLNKPDEQESLRKTFAERTPDFASAALEWVPLAGPLLGEGIKATTGHFQSKHQTVQVYKV